jgi:hypothetical protein
MSPMKERRRDPRIRVDWPVVVRMKNGITVGEARNISARGALIQTEEPLCAKEKFRLFLVPPDRLAFRVTAEVAWLKVKRSAQDFSNCLMGIRFTRVSKGDNQFVLDFLHARRNLISTGTSVASGP